MARVKKLTRLRIIRPGWQGASSTAAKLKKVKRLRRAKKTRMKLRELEMNRLCVFRSAQHIYAQIISPDGSRILASASTVEKGLAKERGNKLGAQKVGELIAKRAQEKKIANVGFDRSGYKYHGCVKVLAESARSAGLKF